MKQKQLHKAVAQKLVVPPFFEIASDHKPYKIHVK